MELIITKEFVVAMTSLQVAEVIGKEHRNVTRDIEDEISKLGTEIGELIFEQTSYTDKSNRQSKMYNLSRDGAMQLGARYDAVTRYKMIQRINELEKAELAINNKTKLLADLFSDDKMTVVNAHKELVKMETKPLVEKLEYQEPIVKYHDEVLKPKNLISVTDIAKDLGITAVRLNRLLHEAKIQYKQSGTWFLYAEHEKKVPEYADYVISEYGQQLKWSEIGRKWIIEVLKK
ncbi:MAG: Rha family transcriptional regulator [Fusobacteriaceae bacterium]